MSAQTAVRARGLPAHLVLVRYKFQPQTSSILQKQLPPSPVLAQKPLLTFVSALYTQHTALQEENQMAGTISAQIPKALRHLQIFKVFPPSNAKTALAEGYKHATITMLKESLKCKESFQMLFRDSLKSPDDINPSFPKSCSLTEC